MKLVMAIIKPFKLDDVREALSSLGIAGMTVSEVKGFGRQKGQTEIYRGAEYSTNMVPKIKIEVVCDDDLAPRVIEAVQAAANSGAIGDGKIRSEEHTSELQSLMRISYAVFCLKKKKKTTQQHTHPNKKHTTQPNTANTIR